MTRLFKKLFTKRRTYDFHADNIIRSSLSLQDKVFQFVRTDVKKTVLIVRGWMNE